MNRAGMDRALVGRAGMNRAVMRMSRVTRLLAILVCPLALMLGAADASAQGKKPAKPDPKTQAFGKKKPGSKPDPKMEEAKRLFDEGAKHYSEGDYEKAVEAWEMSYDISKKELIWLSIANAYERAGQPKKALENLAKWRGVAPEEEHSMLDARIKNLEERVAREEQIEKDRQEQKRKEQEQKELERQRQLQASAGLPVIGIALAGAGAAMVIGGVVLDVVAVGKRPAEEEACRAAGDRQVCRASQQDAIKTSNTLAYVGDVLWITGGVAAAAGIVLIVTQSGPSKPKADATALKVTPIMGPTGAGVFVGASF
jgi:tetratricopeptide (TPR) repeat protein